MTKQFLLYMLTFSSCLFGLESIDIASSMFEGVAETYVELSLSQSRDRHGSDQGEEKLLVSSMVIFSLKLEAFCNKCINDESEKARYRRMIEKIEDNLIRRRYNILLLIRNDLKLNIERLKPSSPEEENDKAYESFKQMFLKELSYVERLLKRDVPVH